MVYYGGFPGGSDGKESVCNAGDLGLIPGLGKSLGEGIGFPLQYSCLENAMNRGAWWATVHGASRSQTCWAAAKLLQSCPTLCDPIDGSPPGPPRLWGSPGKNIGAGCHFLLQCMQVKSESEVSQSCPTLRHPMDYGLPGSPVPGIFQARVLEWGAIAFSELDMTETKHSASCLLHIIDISSLQSNLSANDNLYLLPFPSANITTSALPQIIRH